MYKKELNPNVLKVLIAVIVTVLLAILIAVGYNRPMVKFNRYLNNNEYSKVKKVYDSLKSEDRDSADKMIQDKADKLIDEYNNGNANYSDTEKQVEGLQSVIPSKKYDDRLEKLNNSKEAYSNAQKYISDGEWEKAKSECNKVIENDVNREQADNDKQKCDKNLKLINDAQWYKSVNDWISALEQYDKMTVDTQEQREKSEQYKNDCVENLKTEIDGKLGEMYKNEQYTEGLQLISKAEKYLGQSNSLKAHKENFTAKKEEAERIAKQKKKRRHE